MRIDIGIFRKYQRQKTMRIVLCILVSLYCTIKQALQRVKNDERAYVGMVGIGWYFANIIPTASWLVRWYWYLRPIPTTYHANKYPM